VSNSIAGKSKVFRYNYKRSALITDLYYCKYTWKLQKFLVLFYFSLSYIYIYIYIYIYNRSFFLFFTFFIHIYIYIYKKKVKKKKKLQFIYIYTGLFVMIVGDLTTCHTQYTWDSSICILLFNRTSLQIFVAYLTGALYVHSLWFYKHQHDNRVRSKLFVACLVVMVSMTVLIRTALQAEKCISTAHRTS